MGLRQLVGPESRVRDALLGGLALADRGERLFPTLGPERRGARDAASR